MTAFFTQQMDYIYFVYGLSFFLLGGICLYISRTSKTTTAWEWLGAFGVFHGANEWLDLVAMSLSDDLWGQWLRIGVLTCSFLCLCEFGRRATRGSPGVVNWRWTHALLLAGAATGAVWGVAGLIATIRYALGFTGGLWAALAMFRASRAPRQPGRRWLATAAACFAIYAVAVGLIVPRAPFFPANCINQTAFLRAVGLPVQLVCTAVALASAACLWQYMVAQRRVSLETLGHAKASLYINALAVCLVIVIALGWFMTNAVGQYSTEEMHKSYVAWTQGAAAIRERISNWQQEIVEYRLVVISVTGGVIFLLAGSLLGAQGMRDTNERISASERLYRSVVNNSPNCLQLLDERGRCLAINPKGLEKIGRSEAEMLGAYYLDVWSPETRPVVEVALAMALQGRQSTFEATYLRPDGAAIVWQVILNPVLDRQGHARRVVEIATDITDHRRVEAELRAAKEAAENATRAKTEFLANMSHELRTPITAVLGYSDLLLEPQLSADDQWNYLRTIRRNGEVLLDLIDGILNISKIEAGKLEIDRVACCPRQILADVASLMQVRADGKGLSLSIESDGPLPEIILTDPVRLRQILVNLVGNAIKFTEIGEVRVVARLLSEKGQEPTLQFDVIDTGIGMTQAQMAMIFRPFTQADASTSRKYGGTGLGLTISKRLATMLGGDISVSSKPGQGTTFCLTVAIGPLDGVPLSNFSTTTLESAPAVDTPRPTLNCRILLAEDGPDNQRLLSLILKRAGAEVVVAPDGQKAVELALATFSGQGRRYGDKTLPFDLVLMDIQMPRMDGYAAARRLRQEGFTGPIIALSAHATTEAAQQCIEAGCNDYLTKPIDRDALLQKVAEYVVRDKEENLSDADIAAAPAHSVVEADSPPAQVGR